MWRKVFSVDNNSNLYPNARTMVLHNDTIFIANEVWKTDHKEIRLMSINMNGDELTTVDFYPTYDQILLRGMIGDDNGLWVYTKEVYQSQASIHILHFDFQFNLLEDKYLGDPSLFKFSTFLKKHSDGGFITTYAEDTGLNSTEVVISKLDEELNVLWTNKILPSTWNFSSAQIMETNDNGYMLAWQKDLSYALSDTFPYPTAIYKLDSTATTVEWEYFFAHKSSKEHYSITKTSEGSLFGVGGTDYFEINGIFPERFLDGWCFLIDSNGNLIWEKNIADIRYEGGGSFWHGIEIDGGFAIVGGINDTFPDYDPFINNPQVWFLTLDDNGCWNGNCDKNIVINGEVSTSVNNTLQPTSTVSIFPNPGPGILTIEYDERDGRFCKRKMQLSDSKGNIITTFELIAQKSIINLSHLPNGTYFLTQYCNEDFLNFNKVIIQH